MKVTAQAAVTIRITEIGNWGEDWTVEDVRKSASASAIQTINKIIAKANDASITRNVSIVGNPKITVINYDIE